MPDTRNPIAPTDGMSITQDTCLLPGTYYLPNGIRIAADNVTLDGAGATILGAGQQNVGVAIEGHANVTVKNVKLASYYHGIRAVDCPGLTLEGNTVRDTQEVEHDTIFLEIWLEPDVSYGGAIFLWRCDDAKILGNDVQHQMNGLLLYYCNRLVVRKNVASYNSGYGIHAFNTSDSVFEYNWADYCCRFQPRGNKIDESDPEKQDFRYGHMGGDATGFVIVKNCCRNVFRRNLARMGGDGFFLAGRSPHDGDVNCKDNLFEENDASLSPNIAFEATFSSGNVFRNNYADRCNYGFWLGFSWDNVIEGNRMVMNRQAGIAVENGYGFQVRGNNFQANGHGILLWTHHVPEFAEEYPENYTSHDWTIEENTFTRNGKGIRIAKDQDHGIRPVPEDKRGPAESRPHSHAIRKNDIQDNRIGVELINADRTIIEGNIVHRNVESNFRFEDDSETRAINNLGSAGGYL
ncbi:MAG TPA: right-handed parallel beta-helix repeat-containing protein [Armatimonadota bacterium]|jgi:parallel beta-helix repeat protein